jgi:hypothetical protein
MSDIPDITVEQLRARFDWKKVEAPKTRRPKFNGEELLGYYGGRTLRNGRFGQYEVALIHVPKRGSFMLSGVRLMQLIDAALISEGHPIRVVWGGTVPIRGSDPEDKKYMKMYEVYVADGEVLEQAFVSAATRLAERGQ